MTLITGNTYPVRKQIKALGGIWDKSRQGWLVPDHHAAQAAKLSGCECSTHTSTAPAIVGPCWECKAPEGKFRNYGASTPVLCDACEAKRRATDSARSRSRDNSSFEDSCCGDLAYEDQCAARCGL